MIALEDRQSLAQSINVAQQAGARLHRACEIAGITARTLQVANEARFADMPPARIVPMLADAGR